MPSAKVVEIGELPCQHCVLFLDKASQSAPVTSCRVFAVVISSCSRSRFFSVILNGCHVKTKAYVKCFVHVPSKALQMKIQRLAVKALGAFGFGMQHPFCRILAVSRQCMSLGSIFCSTLLEPGTG